MLLKKKIYFVIPFMGGGGAERDVKILLNYLDREKFDLNLILFNKFGLYLKDIAKDIQIIDLDKKNRYDFFKLIYKLRKVIQNEKPDIIVSFLNYANVITVLSTLWMSKKPTIIINESNNHRGYLPHLRLGVVRRILMSFTYKRADKIIPCSELIRDVLIEDFHINEERIEVIYSFSEIVKIQKLPKQNISHPFFKDKNEKFVLITAGRLTLQKNQSLLIKAFADARRIIPAFLIILGTGELNEDLRTLAKQLGVEKFLDFAGFQEDMVSWIKMSDLFVLSSSWEGFPIALIEAMACGVPIISTDCPSGPAEVITNGKNGILVPPGDVKALSEAILKLYKDKTLRDSLAENGKIRALDFDAKNAVLAFDKILGDK